MAVSSCVRTLGNIIMSTKAPLSPTEVASLRSLVARHGESAIAAAIRVSTHSVLRALGGLPLTSGTRFIIRSYLGSGEAAE